jgi:hypothetical protein
MARDRNTFEKRQRESKKRLKAEAKRVRRLKKKETADDAGAYSDQADAPLAGSDPAGLVISGDAQAD